MYIYYLILLFFGSEFFKAFSEGVEGPEGSPLVCVCVCVCVCVRTLVLTYLNGIKIGGSNITGTSNVDQ